MIYAIITVIHMCCCLSWLIYALSMLSDSSVNCWQPFTFQYLNYYLLLLIALGPACTLGLALVLLIICLPCVVKEIWKIFRDERQTRIMGERVIQGLAKRSFNPEQFNALSECSICFEEFKETDLVTPLSCDVRHYFHNHCIEQWIKTKNECPLCRKEINVADLKEFDKKLDGLLRETAKANTPRNNN